jgi:hypothetical protein
MNRAALEHLLRASSAIVNEREFIVLLDEGMVTSTLLEERIRALPLPGERLQDLHQRLALLRNG